MTTFNNRELDEYEEKMRQQNRCICCGVKLTEKAKQGRWVKWGREASLECAECAQARLGRENHAQKYHYNWGTQMAHKICETLGVPMKDYVSTDMGPEEECDQ